MARTARPGVREKVLEAARAEFARAGLERARVEDIARRARISKGAFYLHFGSKEEAFVELLQRFFGVMEEIARRREDAEQRFASQVGHGSRDELLTRVVEFEAGCDVEILEAFWRNRAFVVALDGAGGRFARMVDDFRRRFRSFTTARVKARQRTGLLRRDVSAEVLSDILVGSYESFGRHTAAFDHKPDLVAWSRAILLVLYDGMLERRRPNGPAGGRRVTR